MKYLLSMALSLHRKMIRNAQCTNALRYGDVWGDGLAQLVDCRTQDKKKPQRLKQQKQKKNL